VPIGTLNDEKNPIQGSSSLEPYDMLLCLHLDDPLTKAGVGFQTINLTSTLKLKLCGEPHLLGTLSRASVLFSSCFSLLIVGSSYLKFLRALVKSAMVSIVENFLFVILRINKNFHPFDFVLFSLWQLCEERNGEEWNYRYCCWSTW
jgi:hypothetical protein